jgi:zinc/manganese transport system substrate-binding protein
MKMKKSLSILATAAGLALAARSGAAPLRVGASLPDLASIAHYLGGDKVEVFSVAKAGSNPHQVEVLPSYMIKVSRAALYLKVGMSLDQWADAIVEGSRNNSLITVDCSQGISVLDKPTGKVDASLGDVHPQGNPHYWLDPANGVVVAGNILEGLKKVDAGNAGFYQANFEKFKTESEAKIKGWKAAMAPLKGEKIITYHSSWAYLADAFGLIVAEHVEPFPGIPPSGSHLAKLVEDIKSNHIKLLLQEPYFKDDAPQFLARQTGIKVVKAPPSCEGTGPQDYWNHFDDLVKKIMGT